MSWNQSAVTAAGAELLNECLAGHTLTITRAAGGSGFLDEALLPGATEFSEEKQTFQLLGIDDLDGCKRVRIQITNEGVPEAYMLRQAAVFARLEYQETERLLCLIQDERGIEVPTTAENPDFLVELYAVIAIANNANIQLTVDRAAVASARYLQESITAVLNYHNTDPKAHADIRSIKAELNIPAGSWTAMEADKNGNAWRADVPCERAAAVHTPLVFIDEAAKAVAEAAVVDQEAEALDGIVRLKAMSKPAGDITGFVVLLNHGNGSSGGGSGGDSTYVLMGDDIFATDEEVTQALDEVFGGSNKVIQAPDGSLRA